MSIMQGAAWFLYGIVFQSTAIYYGLSESRAPWITVPAAVATWLLLRLAKWALTEWRRA